MTIYEPINQPHATAVVTGVPDTWYPSGGTITMDENYSPRIQASITIPLTDPEQGDLITPDTGQRITITAGDESDTFREPRTFDLGIRDRTIDFAAQTMTIEAASDEMLLHDTGRLATTTDRSARQYQTSLRDIVNWALAKIGAQLEPAVPGNPDPDMTATWDQTNLVFNPRGAVDTKGWGSYFSGGGAGTLARSATAGHVVEGAELTSYVRLAITATGTGACYARYGADMASKIPVTPGRLYTASAYVYQDSGVTKTARAWLEFDPDGSDTTIRFFSEFVSVPSGVYTKVSVSGVAPVNAAAAALEFGISNGMPSGKQVGVTAVVFAEGVENDRWFDGDRLDEPDRYDYSYTPDRGTPSTRVALNPIAPELYGWEPGQSLFEFLRPFLEATGTRLWCDEERRWWLDIPRPDSAIGYVQATATDEYVGNVVEGQDVVSRDRDDFATGVVVKSTWRTANGDRKTSYDVAGTEGKVVLVERDAAPAPGMAANLLATMKNRARTQTLTLTSEYYVTPGYEATVKLPGVAEVLMHVRRVELDIATGNATINTTGMNIP